MIVVRCLSCLIPLSAVCLLMGCSTDEPEISAPGRPIETVEVGPEGWKAERVWALEQLSPGVWFAINTAMYGDASAVMRQFVNVLTVDGHPISFRCDHNPSRIMATDTIAADGGPVGATLTLFTRTNKQNGVTEQRYELLYPRQNRK